MLAACSSRKPDILLITLDTTRADSLGCYGALNDPTPTLDAIAYQGLRMERALATAPLTLPSHTSLHSGLTLDHHGVLENGRQTVRADAPLLAERLKANGWHTGAFVAAAVLDHAFGLARGFDVYEDHFADLAPVRGAVVPQWPGDVVVDRALSWLETQQSDQPVFAWVHLYDAHAPYDPPSALLSRFPGDGYEAEVAELDQHVARLLNGWNGQRSRPLVLSVVGDHGESRGEHGENTHGWFVYGSTIRVPWLLSGPGVPSGEVLKNSVSGVDLMPTLLDLAGVDAPAAIDGHSIRDAWSGRIVSNQEAWSESWMPRLDFGISELRALESDGYKAVLAPRPELYNIANDPQELVNLAVDAGKWEPWAARFSARPPTNPRSSEVQTLQVQADLAEKLSVLGYMSNAPVASADLAQDPKDHASLPKALEEAVNAARSRPPAEGLPILDAFLNQYPRVTSVVILRARALGLIGRTEEALASIEPLIADPNASIDLLAQAADYELTLGRTSTIQDRVRALLKKDPQSVVGRASVAVGVMRRGLPVPCLEETAIGLRYSPNSSVLHEIRGDCFLLLGDDFNASASFEEVLRIDPGNRTTRTSLALVLARRGELGRAESLLEEQELLVPEDREARVALGQMATLRGDWERALSLLGPVWEDPAFGSDAALAWATTLEALGRPSSEVDAAYAEARRRRNLQPH
jgi:choline-sulfatase